MKRAVGLIFIVFLFTVGYFSVWGGMPFSPVFDSSMEPALKSGSLLFIKPVSAAGLKTGDIVIYNIPPLIRETYSYPPVVAHRVTGVVKNQAGTSLSLKGDNAGEDPFQARQQDIRGVLAAQIPFLGIPLLLFQSQLTTAFIGIVIVLFALYLYSDYIGIYIRRRFRTFISPIMEENHRVSLVLSNRFEATEKALEGFSNAMALYAGHLASHTSAIQGLSEASQSLKGSAADQNRILSLLTQVYSQQRSREEVSKIRAVVNDFERRTREALQARDALVEEIMVEKGEPHEEIVVHKPEAHEEIIVEKRTTNAEPPPKEKLLSPRGCAVKPKAFLTRPHYYTN
jgi:signal peptidase I